MEMVLPVLGRVSSISESCKSSEYRENAEIESDENSFVICKPVSERSSGRSRVTPSDEERD